MRTIEEISDEMMSYPSYESVPKSLRKEYQEVRLIQVQEEESDIYNRCEISKDISLDRLTEICNAERDGRLVIQPCKRGDKVWEIDTNTITAAEVVAVWFNGLRYIVVCDGIGELILGKDVFITKKEAKVRLKEMEGEKK